MLCIHDPQVLDVEKLLEEMRRLTGVDMVVRPGEEPPEEEAPLRALSVGSGVARATSHFFKGVHVDVLRATEGHMDLGTLAALGFAVAGVVEVAATGKLARPPWSDLGWWAFRTFTTMERTALEHTTTPVRHDGHGSTPPGEDSGEEA